MGLCPGMAHINVVCTNPIVHSLWGLKLDASEAAASVHARRLDTYGGSMEQQLGALLSDDQPARDDLRRVLFSFANFMCNSLEVIQSLRVSSPGALRQCSLFGMRSSVQDVQRLAMRLTCRAGGADNDYFIIRNLPLFLADSARTWLEHLPNDRIQN